MTILNDNMSLLLIIDVQDKLINAAYNGEKVQKNATIMANAASILEVPIIITEQYPKGLGPTIQSVRQAAGEKTLYFEKLSFSAIDNPGVANMIDKSGRKQIVIYGIETHICISQTANALVRKGYEVTVIKDACGSRSEDEHIAGLERMKENGVHIVTTEIALFEWLKGARNIKFKEIQNLIK